jgi:probable rRNA maturation factor
MIEIQKNLSKYYHINTDLIELGIMLTLENHNKPDADITIRLTENPEIQVLNEKYRGVPSATDVLAFNQNFIDPESNREYLGDIIISVERADVQASENNLSLDEECVLLAVHGTLHLLGYDHYEADEKQIMWETQDKIIKTTLTTKQEKHNEK